MGLDSVYRAAKSAVQKVFSEETPVATPTEVPPTETPSPIETYNHSSYSAGGRNNQYRGNIPKTHDIWTPTVTSPEGPERASQPTMKLGRNVAPGFAKSNPADEGSSGP
jgi:hypothetical protein